jgi:putative copper resistance protein D
VARPLIRPLLLAALVTAVALVAGLLLTGAAKPLLLVDPGPFVRWGLPAVRAVNDIAGVVTVGALLLAATVVPSGGAGFRRAVTIASAAAVTWTLAGVPTLVLIYADAAGMPITDPQLGQQLATFLTSVELIRNLFIGVLMAAAVAVLTFGIRTSVGAGMVCALAAAAWFPVALTGHSAQASGHESAVSGWWFHILGLGAWLGGMATLALLRSRLSRGAEVADAAARYSTLAGWGFALVVVSGVANAWLRLSSWSDLLHGYGLLVLLKTIATVSLGVAGWWHRRSTLPKLTAAEDAAAVARPFWRLVGGELVLFGATMGLAVALGRSSPPVPVDQAPPDATPAQLLTGYPLPPPLTAARWFTETRPDLLWLVVAAALGFVYLRGVVRLRSRGDAWPVGRTISWMLGLALLLYLTCGGPAAYGRVLFSVHMVQHMLLSMAVPSLLVVGAPMTLALRAIPRRRDGSMGAREWLLKLIENPWARFVSNPVVAAIVFAGSLMLFYWSPLFPVALSTHLGHELMTIHFLLAGYLFVQAVIGIDPGPQRTGYPLRLVLLLATMAFHAFFGVAIMSSERLLAATWFSSLGWGIDALADQQSGGAIAWGIGEFPTLILAMVVAFQWANSDEREARRRDRAADRDKDAELEAYNAMLQRMASRDSE